jgi:5-carboxymethyl-2-hydroxymuconate isomerase
MPHFIVEYSKNLEDRVDLQAFSDELRDIAIETGVYPLGGLRVRFHECSVYTIADSGKDYAFVHIQIRMGEGRDDATKTAASTLVFDRTKVFLQDAFDVAPSALSVEIVEIDSRYSHKYNKITRQLPKT